MEWLPAIVAGFTTGKTDQGFKLADDPGQIRHHFALGLACKVGLLDRAGYPRSNITDFEYVFVDMPGRLALLIGCSDDTSIDVINRIDN